MKKRCFPALWLALMLVWGLAGCAVTNSGGETSVAVTAVEAGSTEAPEEEGSILDGRQPLDETGALWYIENDYIQQANVGSLETFRDQLLVVSYVYTPSEGEGDVDVTLVLALLSLRTGEPLYEVSFENMDCASVQVCGDRIALCDQATGDIRILDDTLQVTEKYQVEAKGDPVYLNAAADTAYCFVYEGGVQVTRLETGETATLLENSAHLYAAGVYGDRVVVGYTDRDTLLDAWVLLNPDTGEMESCPFEASVTVTDYSDGCWLGHRWGEDDSLLAVDGVVRTLPEDLEGVSLLEDPALLFVTRRDEDGTLSFSLYQPDGSFLSGCSLDRAKLPNGGKDIPAPDLLDLDCEPVRWEEESGYLTVLDDGNGHRYLLFWDRSVGTEGEDLTLTEPETTDPTVGNQVDAELYRQAIRLWENYGMEIYIAEQVETDFSDFTAEPLLAGENIAQALDAVERALAAYPEGYLSQLNYSDYSGIRLYLTGPLTKKEEGENGYGYYSGFTSEEGDAVCVVLDITWTDIVEQNVYHEFSHILDRRLEYYAGICEDALYSAEGWEAFNPVGFDYAWAYDGLTEDFYEQANTYYNWFIDDYSCTYPTEDRARVMEYAMMGAAWRFEGCPGLLNKLDYYSRCIRDLMDTEGWPEVTCWERTLLDAGGSAEEN